MVTLTDSGSDYKPIEAGAYGAICSRVIDLGTQTYSGIYGEKSARKVMITWEVPEVIVEWEGNQRPATISQTFTSSLHEKANLRAVLESWRGKKFTADELKGFDTKAILGAACMLNVVHTEKDGRTYANVAAVMPLPKGTPKPEGSGSLINFDLDDYDPEVFGELHEKLQDKIKASPEYLALVSGGDSFSTQANGGVSGGGDTGAFDDEIPF